MREVRVIVVHPMDPMGSKVGGIEAYIKDFIKKAPPDFSLGLVGVTTEKKEKVGKWCQLKLHGRSVQFLPVMFLKDENRRSRVPLSLRFTLATFRYRPQIPLKGCILEFHRLEPSLPFLEGTCPKTLFVHFDPGEFHSSLSEQLWARFPRLFFAMERCLIGNFDRVFSISRATGALYKAKYPSVRVNFSSDFVDDGLFYPSSFKDVQEGKKVLARSPGVSRRDRWILFVGRLAGVKDVELLVSVFQEVVSLRDRSRLVVVGTGEMEGKARELVKEKGLDDKVTFMGPLPPGKVAELMRNSHALLLTSHFEAGPRVVLEAIASGLPVVSTDVGFVGSVVKGNINGVVCTRREPLLMARALLSVMEGWGPRRVWPGPVVKRYGTDRVLGEVYESYREITQGLGEIHKGTLL